MGGTRASLGSLVSASELRRGLEAERVMPSPDSAGLLVSWLASDRPAEPRVTELPAFLRDVLHEPGASVAGGLLGSCFFTWLAVVLEDMEVGSRLALRLLFKLFMISLFFAFSATVERPAINKS